MWKPGRDRRGAALRRARYGYLLALHIVLLCAAGRTPTDIAAVLFCSRSSVYRTVRASREGTLGWKHDDQGRFVPPVCTTGLLPTLRRSLLDLLKAPPRAYGWCRTRWSCAKLALTWPSKRGIAVSPETMRHWLHEIGWVWKRTKLVAKDDDPQGVNRLARMRWVCEPLKRGEAMVCADALDIHIAIHSRLCLDAQRDPSGSHDPRPASKTRPGRGPPSGHWDAASLFGAAQHQRTISGPTRAPES